MSDRPSGTTTFLMTDIEGSTRRWEENPDAMRAALARHDIALKGAIEGNGGWLFKHTGDGVLAAFHTPRAAIAAAVAAQRALELPVRMGICTGEAELRGEDYFGPALNRAARTMVAGHGGQVLVTASTAAMIESDALVDLGEYRLRDLSQPQRLYQVRADGLKQDFPPLKTLDLVPGNLPGQATSFLGRDKHLAIVLELLAAGRLVTLAGVGGVGKTRLALQAAAEASPGYPDGAWLVELASLRDATSVGDAVANALGTAQQPGKTIEQSVLAWFGHRQLLLVLDNCEHLIEAVANLVHEIVTRCPNVKILATSREALMVDGERTWPVPSLGVREGEASAAVALFVERARAVVPDFALGADGPAVGDICRRLDGIPLAIELAAARTRTMSPAQIAGRLEERFRLLTGGSRRALERHQSLRQTVQWSFDLLTPAERATLSRASAFAGEFTLEAAERVCAGSGVEDFEVVDLLDSLVRKSLMVAVRAEGAVRYILLETIRQFGEEQLAGIGESEAVRARHAAFYADDSDAQFQIWRSPREREAFEWLDHALPNLRAAFRWAVDGKQVDIAARIASNVGDMGRFRLREEAANWASEIVDAARASAHPRLMVLLTWAASSSWAFQRFEDTKRYGEEALSLIDDERFYQFVWAHIDLAFVAAFEGDVEKAIELCRTGSLTAPDAQDRLCLAVCLMFEAMAHPERAMARADGVVASAEATGVPVSIGLAHYSKGKAFAAHDPALALACFDRALAIGERAGNPWLQSLVMPDLAALQARTGDPVRALGSFQAMLVGWRGVADLGIVAGGLGNLTVLFDRHGLWKAAATMHGKLTGEIDLAAFTPELAAALAHARTMLGDSEFDEVSHRGRLLTLVDVIAYAESQVREALAAIKEKSAA